MPRKTKDGYTSEDAKRAVAARQAVAKVKNYYFSQFTGGRMDASQLKEYIYPLERMEDDLKKRYKEEDVHAYSAEHPTELVSY